MRLGRASDGELTSAALDLRLDLSGQDNIELKYTILNFFDETHVQEGLYFSDDGGANFVQVREFDIGEEAINRYFNQPPVDIDALAAANGLSLTSEFVVRFQQIGTGNFSTSGDEDGFILDAITVTAPEIEYAPLGELPGGGIGFEDSFEDGTFGPMWQVSTPSEPASGEPTAPAFAPSRLGSRVEVFSAQNADDGTFHVYLGRLAAGPLTTSSLDLRLNLSGQSQVELQFALSDIADETQQQEGLYFSDDGGNSFEQVVFFDPSNRPNGYADEVVDVDALAIENGLSLTSEFVIRFQQIGTGDIGFAGDEDGFLLDDVVVTGGVVTSTDDDENFLPGTFVLQQNFPNPFNPTTQIRYSLPQSGEVQLLVFNMLGQKVATLVDGQQSAGWHTATFDASGLSSGTYIYQIQAGDYISTKKLTLIK
jgi:hypothetical protein